jgi:hypothetical protein
LRPEAGLPHGAKFGAHDTRGQPLEHALQSRDGQDMIEPVVSEQLLFTILSQLPFDLAVYGEDAIFRYCVSHNSILDIISSNILMH